MHTASPRLFVFDLDGTLVDSRRDIAEAANELLVSYGAAAIAEEDIGRMVGDGAATLVIRALKAAGIERPPDALERFLAIYDERLLNHTKPYDGVPGVLDALGRNAALAVLTNKPIAATRRILDGLDLSRYFPANAVIGGDGPFPRKPDPSALLHLAAQAIASPLDTIMVGDSAIDWRTARAAGTRVCLAGYGFGFGSLPIHELAPDERVISTFSELLGL
ncbi:MAG TPA: HAD-IA family hydrolase [Vicinamibacterales bacterium]|nr:HAD-IA family hydrolase [Vicinamibacterales bacterium]